MRILFMIIIFIVSYPCFSGDTQVDFLPPSAKPALDKMDQAIYKARADAIKVLEKLMEAETKKGNLNGALALQKKGEEIQKLMDDGKDLLGNPIVDDIATGIIGKWKRSDGFDCIFTADGKGTIGPHDITWKVSAKNTITALFPKYPDWWMKVTIGEKLYIVTLNSGQSMTLTKQ